MMPIQSDLYYPVGIAFGIFLISLYLYTTWSQVIQESINEIEKLTNGIKNKAFLSEDIFTAAIEGTKNKRIKDLLQESKRNLISIDGDLGPERYCLKRISRKNESFPVRNNAKFIGWCWINVYIHLLSFCIAERRASNVW